MKQSDREHSSRADDAATDQLLRGPMVQVVDGKHRENEGDLTMAAGHATAEAIAFVVHHRTGLVRSATAEQCAYNPTLPSMVAKGDRCRCPWHLSARCCRGGVARRRAGHTAAADGLGRFAAPAPIGVLTELVREDHSVSARLSPVVSATPENTADVALQFARVGQTTDNVETS
ncbi:hypothetical protein JCM18899A_09560 [Nocardioides sp. AN3]